MCPQPGGNWMLISSLPVIQERARKGTCCLHVRNRYRCGEIRPCPLDKAKVQLKMGPGLLCLGSLWIQGEPLETSTTLRRDAWPVLGVPTWGCINVCRLLHRLAKIWLTHCSCLNGCQLHVGKVSPSRGGDCVRTGDLCL